MVNRYSFQILICILLVSCYSAKDISTQNLVAVYRTTEHVFQPEFSLFHLNDSTTRLSIRLKPDDFLFVRQADNSYKANLKVTILKTYSYEANVPLDTFYCSSEFDMNEKGQTKIVNCDFTHSGVGTFLLRVYLNDVNKNYEEDYFVPMENEGKQLRQFYQLTNLKGELLFDYYLEEDDTVRIISRDTLKMNLWCKYYRRDFPLAAPPHSFDTREGFNYRPDSVFEINLHDTNGIVLSEEGFYHFQNDTLLREGLTLYRFGRSFPMVTSPAQMLEAMRYLTSKREYDEMKSSPALRNAVDAFWLSRGGNPEKSRALIRSYYNRVQEANLMFTSFVEGWKTDRGMIYTIFGMPNTVYRSSSSESWIYGTPNSTLALNFLFTRVNNPFSDNDLVLSRSPIYESSWYRAVETWRQGRVYNSIY
ncbi:MAG: GWxTD domain-containing protein [Bacteroidia bacterium]|nr:GWxTD domain-containing protein [Bacteroidia bacterium]